MFKWFADKSHLKGLPNAGTVMGEFYDGLQEVVVSQSIQKEFINRVPDPYVFVCKVLMDRGFRMEYPIEEMTDGGCAFIHYSQRLFVSPLKVYAARPR